MGLFPAYERSRNLLPLGRGGCQLKGWLLKPGAELAKQGELVESFIGQEMMAYSSPNMCNALYYWQRREKQEEVKLR